VFYIGLQCITVNFGVLYAEVQCIVLWNFNVLYVELQYSTVNLSILSTDRRSDRKDKWILSSGCCPPRSIAIH
jgi:hypothetical protein